MRKAAIAVLAGTLCVAASTVEAQRQSTARRFSVTPSVGVISWDEASALANKRAGDDGQFTESVRTPVVGVTANYMILNQLGIGFYFDAARPQTRGDYFPALLLRFGNDAQLRTVSQRVTTLIYGIQARAGLNIGRLEPYVVGGVGAVTVDMDPQQNDGNRRFSTGATSFGGGLGFNVGPGAITLDVRDHIFMSWDRSQLNPVNPILGTVTDYQNTLFPTVNVKPPADKSTVSNIRIALGFRYVPKLTSGTGDTDEDKE